eukprot:TRINITY_DN18910_c0_g1_i1.p1 TRINITY_DN18910_c0_g1~~TRINITY_DN18910_c0_g1_i1.p1  ORF type:complete len:720 (+),score=142.35 TRINITY_DN18910_c0_g1_i1:76-2235(+)
MGVPIRSSFVSFSRPVRAMASDTIDLSRCTTAVAAEIAEELAASAEVAASVGSVSAAHLQARVRAVYTAMGGPRGPELADAVADLARDCVTLPEWVERDFQAEEEAGGEFSWTFGVEVAEVVAAGVAAVAGLAEPGVLSMSPEHSAEVAGVASSDTAAKIFDVLEELGREIDCLAPYLFGGLCRVDVAEAMFSFKFPALATRQRRLRMALQGVCAWSLIAVGRVVGYGRLDAGILWEWAAGDPLWALVLAKGALAPLEDGVSALAKLSSPLDHAALQDALVAAVLGLTSPNVAFSKQLKLAAANAEAGRLSHLAAEEEEVSIQERSAQLAQHRARLASTMAESQLLGSLCVAVMSTAEVKERHRRCVKLAALVASLLQPGLEASSFQSDTGVVTFTAYSTIEMAKQGSAELRSSIGWFADDLWAAFASVTDSSVAAGFSALPPRGFLRDCSAIALASPVGQDGCDRLLRGCTARFVAAIESMEDSTEVIGSSLAALCVIAANAGLRPTALATGTASGAADGGLSDTLQGVGSAAHAVCPATRAVAIRDLAAWRGALVRQENIGVWLALVESGVMTVESTAPHVVPGDATPAVAAGLQAPASSAAGGAPLRDLLRGAPEELRCAIDARLLTDPVRSPYGHVFERSVLADALRRSNGICPITGAALRVEDCSRDTDLRQRCVRWVREHRNSRQARKRRLAEVSTAKQQEEALPQFSTLFGD